MRICHKRCMLTKKWSEQFGQDKENSRYDAKKFCHETIQSKAIPIKIHIYLMTC